jgi:hypothetical protein
MIGSKRGTGSRFQTEQNQQRRGQPRDVKTYPGLMYLPGTNTQVAIAAGLITTNAAMKTVLLVGVDMIHRLSDPTDPGIFLWGDGAGAAVMEAAGKAAQAQSTSNVPAFFAPSLCCSTTAVFGAT